MAAVRHEQSAAVHSRQHTQEQPLVVALQSQGTHSHSLSLACHPSINQSIHQSINRPIDMTDAIAAPSSQEDVDPLPEEGGLVSSFGRDSTDDLEDYVLRCYSFPEKKEKLRFSIPLQIAMRQYLRLSTGLSTGPSTSQTPISASAAPPGMPSPLVPQAQPAAQSAPFSQPQPAGDQQAQQVPSSMQQVPPQATPFMVNAYNGLYHRAVPPPAQFLTFVSLAGNACCLCQQHLPTDSSPTAASSIRVTIFIIHQKSKLEFAIPLTDIDAAGMIVAEHHISLSLSLTLTTQQRPPRFASSLDVSCPTCFSSTFQASTFS